jgi:hypothetical protein
MKHSSQSRSAAALRRAVPLLVLLVAACDPCFGTSACEPPQILYEGILRDQRTGEPIPQIPIRFLRREGVALSQDTVSAMTDAAGRFRLEAPAEAIGVVTGDLYAKPSERAGYVRTATLSLTTTRVRGDLRFVETHLLPARISHVGEIWWRASGLPAAGVRAEFRRTGGVQTVDGTSAHTSSENGRFIIAFTALTDGEIVGDLVLQPPPPFRTRTIEGMRLETRREEHFLEFIAVWGLGLHISYRGEIVWLPDLDPAPGIELEFRRTGGIELVKDRIVMRTDQGGSFILQVGPRDEQEGEVVGELIVRPPPPLEPYVVPGLRLSTSAVDGELRFLGRWVVGPP